MESENRYTSFDLMKIFGIKKGSWYNVKNKFELDQYSEQLVEGKQVKFVYSQKAYDILKENYQKKIVKEIKENPKMFSLIQENETLKATLDEYKQISSKFESLYNEERAEKERLISDKAVLQATNTSYMEKNHLLEGEKYKLEMEKQALEQEISKMKNRSIWARIFNK